MRKIMIIMALLMLVACAPKNDDANSQPPNKIERIDANDYCILYPYELSNTREYHTLINNRYDYKQISKELMQESKQYFNPKEYCIQESQILNMNALRSLVVTRESPNNPQGLNPAEGIEIEIGTNKTLLDSPRIVTDLYEQNYYALENNEYVMKGTSFVIVLNEYIEIETAYSVTTHKFTNEQLQQYGTEMARRLERYIRSNYPDAYEIPILVTLYAANTRIDYLPGRMFGKIYFQGKKSNFEPINTQWYILPSQEINNFDPNLSNRFLVLKKGLQSSYIENVGVIGKVKYKDSAIEEFNIEVNVQSKTYTELLAIIKQTSELILSFENYDYDINVIVQSLDEIHAIITLKANASVPETKIIQ